MTMNRRQFVGALGATAMASPWLHSMNQPRKPNVLIIQPDQHLGLFMGCAGHPQIQTPNLDKLAQQGTRFHNSVANSPVCCPWRGSMQTGLYWHQHGVISNNLQLDFKHRCIAEIFADDGYDTGYIGKWHLDGGDPKTRPTGNAIPPGPNRQGWQEWWGHQKGHTFYQPHYYRDNGEEVRLENYEWEPAWHTDRALDFARRKSRENKPWLYYVSYGPPHNPTDCPQRFLDMYPQADIQLNPAQRRSLKTKDEEMKLRQLMQVYMGQITWVDYEVGRLLKGLEEQGIADNTLIMYTSDHGDNLLTHRYDKGGGGLAYRGKSTPLQYAYNVPLIFRWPGKVKAGQVHDTLTSGVDLTPTLLDMAGLGKHTAHMPGHSLKDWLIQGEGHKQQAIYMGLGGTDMQDKGSWRAVYDGRYCYSPDFQYMGDKSNRGVLWDYRNDPHELENRISNKPITGSLKDTLFEFMKDTEDPRLRNLRQLLA